MTMYAICRGFTPVDPKVIKSEEQRQLASYPNGMEGTSCGTIQISVTQMLRMNLSSIRLGRGYTFFDLEWEMHFGLTIVESVTP